MSYSVGSTCSASKDASSMRRMAHPSLKYRPMAFGQAPYASTLPVEKRPPRWPTTRRRSTCRTWRDCRPCSTWCPSGCCWWCAWSGLSWSCGRSAGRPTVAFRACRLGAVWLAACQACARMTSSRRTISRRAWRKLPCHTAPASLLAWCSRWWVRRPQGGRTGRRCKPDGLRPSPMPIGWLDRQVAAIGRSGRRFVWQTMSRAGCPHGWVCAGWSWWAWSAIGSAPGWLGDCRGR